MGSITAQVRELGGDGVIGVELSQSGRTHAVRRSMVDSKDLEVTFHAMGTVVREDAALAGAQQPAPLKVLRLS